mmetsp:Transcript_22262/g.44856  ORF Transcript_22262/g.44856 Transcript_22262/m.44856 type:complete len:249 (+) Transcript_22262:259-1005(+)
MVVLALILKGGLRGEGGLVVEEERTDLAVLEAEGAEASHVGARHEHLENLEGVGVRDEHDVATVVSRLQRSDHRPHPLAHGVHALDSVVRALRILQIGGPHFVVVCDDRVVELAEPALTQPELNLHLQTLLRDVRHKFLQADACLLSCLPRTCEVGRVHHQVLQLILADHIQKIVRRPSRLPPSLLCQTVDRAPPRLIGADDVSYICFALSMTEGEIAILQWTLDLCNSRFSFCDVCKILRLLVRCGA